MEVDEVIIHFESLFSEVLEVPTDKPLSEQQAWSYLRDIILGTEYCKYSKTSYFYLPNIFVKHAFPQPHSHTPPPPIMVMQYGIEFFIL